MDTSQERTCVGIDVSKKQWDVNVENSKTVTRYKANQAGDLIDFLRRQGPVHVCLEATGVYHQALVEALHKAEITVSVVNPAQVRNFARAHGQLAKTDSIDARILTRFASMMKPEPTPKTPENQKKLRALRTRRQQLIDARTQDKNRLDATRDQTAQASIEAALEFYNEQIASLDEQLQQLMRVDPEFQKRLSLLTSVPGVGTVTAATLMAEMPELGNVDRRQAARLAGLAPVNRDSGQLRGKRMIGGGRPQIRKGLYMATLVATKHNPVIRDFYQQLLAKGKKKMVALTACMRKLLLILNAIVKENKSWKYENVAEVA